MGPGRRLGTLTINIVLLLLLWGVTASAEPGNASPRPLALSVRGDRISVNIDQAPLRDVLAELARQVPLTVYAAGPVAQEAVTMTFRNLPLEEGVERILEGKQYVLIHDRPQSANGAPGRGRIIKILVMPRVGSPAGIVAMETKITEHPVANPVRQTVTPMAKGPKVEQLRRQALEAKDPVARVEALEALSEQGKGEEVLPILAKALQDKDDTVREIARELLNDYEPADTPDPE